MVLPGHLASGYLVTTAILHFSGLDFSHNQTIALYIIGTLAGEGPDIDLFRYYFDNLPSRKKKDVVANHRIYFTHAPVVWLLFSLAIVAIGSILNSQFVSTVGWLILAGSWSHFIFDSIESGIAWLWPYSHKRYCIHEFVERDIPGQKGTFAYYWKFLTGDWTKMWVFYVEVIVTLIALWVFLGSL
ncbi:MAG: metal-dependent hydrolase [Candidatus Paceibacterota bacterium]|jgi:hypothetical protein